MLSIKEIFSKSGFLNSNFHPAFKILIFFSGQNCLQALSKALMSGPSDPEMWRLCWTSRVEHICSTRNIFQRPEHTWQGANYHRQTPQHKK